MTESQIRRIRERREEGDSYASIARELSLSANTVKSYCQRNKIVKPTRIMEPSAKKKGETCVNCKKPLEPGLTGRPKRFCSEGCRRAWWEDHPEESKKKAYYTVICKECGIPFESYGNKNRKFCCHACFIKNRFERMKQNYDNGTI
ncbi:RNA polymerase subunit sigma-70 [Clostridia bacterium]|nr:RNA polymerase subunit sigma-70 [Clostridia bacterium]